MTVIDPNTDLAIASTTDATPIVCVTSSAHNLVTADEVGINGHLVNVAANGQHTITVIDAVTFSLDGSVGSGAGAGGATGVVKPWTAGGIDGPTPGTPRNAASVLGAVAALADRVAFLRLLNVLKTVEKTTPGAYTDLVPDGACTALIEIYGGGGSGGGGAGSNTGTGNDASGGGAGGGALEGVHTIDVVPGTTITGTVGAGGVGVSGGAAGGHNGTSGNPGGDSTCVHGATTITGKGAGGGCAGIYNASASVATLSPGGTCVSSSGAAFVFATGGFIPQAQMPLLLMRGISEGGYSGNDTAAGVGRNAAGNPSRSYVGGAAGTNGAADTGRLGGSGGGGGGGGPGGPGGDGGAGHAGENGNSTCAGSPGLGPAANSGAGSGGGGGAGASNNGSGSAGGGSVDAGAGKVRITYIGGVK